MTSTTGEQEIKKKKYWLTAARIFSLTLVIGVTVLVYSVRDQAEELAKFGYLGIFLIALLSYATILIPTPGIAVVFAMGAVFNPFYIALAAGAGGALGELSGYLAGFSSQAVVERTQIYDRFSGWIRENGFITVLILAAIPNPFFDIAGVAAGILKMPIRSFLFAVWMGVTIKMLIFALAGSTSLSWFLDLL